MLETDGRWVSGVAQLYDFVFAVLHSAPFIVVYVTRPAYRRINDVAIEGLKTPWDLTASPTTGHLYIADGSGHCLWRVKVDRPPPLADRDIHHVDVDFVKWTEDVGSPLSLSVTRRGEVVVVDGVSAELSVYAGDGETGVRIAVIQLKDKGIMAPWHAVQTSADTFIVCHGGGANSTSDRICEIDKTGAVLKRWNGGETQRRQEQSGSATVDGVERRPLSRPGHLAPAAGGGTEYRKKCVMDSYDVKVLSGLLRVERILLQRPPDTAPNWPTRLSYDGVTGRLVVLWCKGFIHVYQ